MSDATALSPLLREMVRREALRLSRHDEWYERVVGYPDPQREAMHVRIGRAFGWRLSAEALDAILADETILRAD